MSAPAPSGGVGVDVLDRRELARLMRRPWFLRYCYSSDERQQADRLGPDRRLEFLAGRFAAKEAVLKLLGRGLLQGLPPCDISVTRTDDGAPAVRFLGRVAALEPPPVAVSITHKQHVAAAVAISRTPSCRRDGTATSGRPPGTEDTMASADDDEAVRAFLRVRVGQEDAHYGGDLVDGARLLKLFGDLVTEITIRTDGDEGLLTELSDVRFTAPVTPGDYIEAVGHLEHSTRLRRRIGLHAYKVITSTPGSGTTAAEPMAEPQLVCSATATTVVPRRPTPPGGDG